jgi:hypothetical protein
MSSPEDRAALRRYVAGLDVEPDALATAITADAVDHAAVEDALLLALGAAEPVARLRAARRIARLPELPPRVLARLRVLIEHDGDPRVSAAAATALAAHEDEPAVAKADPPRRLLKVLSLELLDVRGEERFAYAPAVRGAHLDTGAVLTLVDDVPQLELTDLPTGVRGRHPLLLIDGERLGNAAAAVSASGVAVFTFPEWNGSLLELSDLLDESELAIDEG